jgi:predicted nucleic acid-binding protein
MTEPTPDGPVSLQPVVVDTDVVSYLIKADTRAARFRSHLLGRVPVISFMTLAELDSWADQHNWGRPRRERLARFLANYTPHFPDRRLCQLWGAVTAAGRRIGRPISTADAWIAATALFLDAPLVTHNPADFASLHGLTVISDTIP